MDESIYLEDDGGQGWHHQEQLLEQQLFEEKQSRLTLFNCKRKSEMSLIAKDTGTDRTFELAPAGAFAARCFRVIDLGTQTFTVMGETKMAHQCLISWELGKTMADGRPYTINEKYTVSLHEKAKLRTVLESWRGKKFTEAERKGFDLKNILGKVCFINIVHAQKGEKEFANVASVMPVPDGMTSPPASNEQLYFSINDWDESAFQKVPKFYQEMIKKSPEFQQVDAVGTPGPSSDQDDDIPF
jgi:hypothetical protein